MISSDLSDFSYVGDRRTEAIPSIGALTHRIRPKENLFLEFQQEFQEFLEFWRSRDSLLGKIAVLLTNILQKIVTNII